MKCKQCDNDQYVGKSIHSEGCRFFITEATRESNQRFTWIVATARWTGFGLRPLFADEDKRFILGRRKKT